MKENLFITISFFSLSFFISYSYIFISFLSSDFLSFIYKKNYFYFNKYILINNIYQKEIKRLPWKNQ